MHHLVEGARALAPLLRASAGRGDAEREVPDEIIAEMAARGMFRLMVPRRLGGFELSLLAYCDVVTELARGDGSAGWLGFILNANDWIVAAAFPEAVQETIWGGDPDVRIAGVFEGDAEMRRAEGGWVVDGRFAYTSGCRHAAWGLFGVPMRDEGGQMLDQGMVLMRTAAMDWQDTWHVSAMRGTGSNTLVATSVFVPEAFVTSFSRAAAGAPGARAEERGYFAPFVPAAVLMLVPALLGMAQAALEVTIARLGQGGTGPGRRVAYTFYGDSREAAPTQMRLAQAASLVDSAALHVRHWAARLDAVALAGEEMALVERARVRMACAHAAQCCKDALQLLLDIQGSSGFAVSNPMERIARDLAMASRHGLMNLAFVQEAYGRALLGIEAQNTPLL